MNENEFNEQLQALHQRVITNAFTEDDEANYTESLFESIRHTNPSFVKKTLSIPGWLNEDALALNVNFSQVLQDALTKLVTKQHA